MKLILLLLVLVSTGCEANTVSSQFSVVGVWGRSFPGGHEEIELRANGQFSWTVSYDEFADEDYEGIYIMHLRAIEFEVYSTNEIYVEPFSFIVGFESYGDSLVINNELVYQRRDL